MERSVIVPTSGEAPDVAEQVRWTVARPSSARPLSVRNR